MSQVGTEGPSIEGGAAVLAERGANEPEVFLVLGSGLGELVDAVEDRVEVLFAELPGFPPPGVTGHGGRFVWGRLEGRPVLLQAGRYHVYEGHPLAVVVAPVRLAARLGIRSVILTNAAGGVDTRRLRPGSLLLLEDHLNLSGRSPLAGAPAPGEERFPDMSAPYDPGLRALFREKAMELGIGLEEGVYAWMTGPSYETPAEIRMLARAGAHVVGMSTVPEVITARALGLRTAALSLVTNLAAGRSSEPLSHEEVLRTGRMAAGRVERLVRAVVRDLAQGSAK